PNAGTPPVPLQVETSRSGQVLAERLAAVCLIEDTPGNNRTCPSADADEAHTTRSNIA
ncbi:hypothetical protein P7K49_027929, partial [Saguinus oedipus]